MTIFISQSKFFFTFDEIIIILWMCQKWRQHWFLPQLDSASTIWLRQSKLIEKSDLLSRHVQLITTVPQIRRISPVISSVLTSQLHKHLPTAESNSDWEKRIWGHEELLRRNVENIYSRNPYSNMVSGRTLIYLICDWRYTWTILSFYALPKTLPRKWPYPFT